MKSAASEPGLRNLLTVRNTRIQRWQARQEEVAISPEKNNHLDLNVLQNLKLFL